MGFVGPCHGHRRTSEQAVSHRRARSGDARDERPFASSAGLLVLQRTVGNQAVGALLRGRSSIRPIPRPPVVQRCGRTSPDDCPCHETDGTSTDQASLRTPLQRRSVDHDSACSEGESQQRSSEHEARRLAGDGHVPLQRVGGLGNADRGSMKVAGGVELEDEAKRVHDDALTAHSPGKMRSLPAQTAAQTGVQPGGGHAETLDDIPVAGSAETLQRVCGSAAIGAPSGCTPASAEPVGEQALFRVNCDDFSTPDQQRVIEDFADSMLPTDAVNVHGFASVEGPGGFNLRLSCARALKTVGVLLGKGVSASQIRIFSHGATPGNAGLRRSVVLERDPPVSRAAVPQLSATVVTATPGACGGINFVIQWNLSRDSTPLGGFIIQAVSFVWSVIDCTGTPVPNPDPRTSPLQYFEAWRVAPNSRSLSPVTTDTFFWPDVNPWGGGCTDGVVSITGIAQYHDNVDTLPPHMVANNAATFAGILQSSLTDPALGGAVSNTFDHRLAFHWTCCPCSSSPTVIDDRAP